MEPPHTHTETLAIYIAACSLSQANSVAGEVFDSFEKEPVEAEEESRWRGKV